MKKLLNRKQKGFTIVELVIVIAVIGILAGVLIPVFINLNNKANKAADEALVKNLNTALATQEQETGDTKNATFHDAVEDLKEYGYLLPNLVAKSDEDLLWDRETNRFLLEEDAESDKTLDYWRIQDNLDEQKYNVYAGPKFAATSVTNLKVGFDAGDFEGLESISYVGNGETAQSVVIRSNSAETALTVNAPLDTVHHYDLLDDLTVTAVAGASYHEHGIVRGKATVSQGHFAIEKTGEVPQIDVKTATGAVKVTANAATLVNVDSASSSKTSVVVENDNVYVTGIASDKVSGSKADKVEFPTTISNETELATAITAKKGFMQISSDFAVENSYTIASKTVFDFAGHTITTSLIGEAFIVNESNLTFTDSGEEGGIDSANNNVIINKANMTIIGGSFKGNRAYTIAEATADTIVKRGVVQNASTGTMVINNIYLYTKMDYGFLNLGVATINNGTFRSDSNDAAYSGARYSYCVTNENELTINNADVRGIHGGIGGNSRNLIINNATSKAVNYYAVYVAGEVGVSSAVINNGSFESEKESAVLVGNSSDGGNGLPADVTINNGVFKGSTVSGGKPAVKTSKQVGGSTYGLGFITINGGKYNTNISGANGVNTCVQGSDGLWVVNA